MSPSLRVALMLSILTMVACGELIGIRDVPVPDDGGADATAADDARGTSSGDDRDTGLASGDGPARDAPGDEAPGTDGSNVPVDGAMESAVPEAGAEASADTGVDAATCAALKWDTYNASCNLCGIMQCCVELATCEGTGRCGTILFCITGYTGSPMNHDQQCETEQAYSQSEVANAQAALSCVRSSQSCSVPTSDPTSDPCVGL